MAKAFCIGMLQLLVALKAVGRQCSHVGDLCPEIPCLCSAVSLRELMGVEMVGVLVSRCPPCLVWLLSFSA